jgi:hypothetical protein
MAYPEKRDNVQEWVDDPADAARVQAAVQTGSIRGFFSETLVTIEGIQTKDRPAVLSSSRLVSSSSSAENENSITIKLAFQQDRNPPEPRFSERIQTARSLGMRAGSPLTWEWSLRQG